jgi:hypothetical protein
MYKSVLYTTNLIGVILWLVKEEDDCSEGKTVNT